MTTYKQIARKNLADQMIKKLEKRNMEGYYCETKEGALKKAISFLEPGCSISWGGSESLNQMGFMDYMKEHKDEYQILDRFAGETAEEKREIYGKATMADYYYMSANAITKDGVIVNMDGSGNRVASLCHGPAHVVLVIGMNKVAFNIEDAVDRIHLIAGPTNTIRQNMDTPCSKTGSCADCLSKDCICCNLVITRYNRQDGRIKVILVGDDLGF
jgi:hypothetical protein